MLKKKFFAGLALAACAGLAVTGAGAVVYAAQEQAPAPAAALEDAAAPQAADDAGERLLSSVEQDEMVYVMTDASGRVEKIIVSDWVRNSLGAAQTADGEAVRPDADGTPRWDAQGDELYDQREVEKELPVTLSVSYRLDGKSVSPQEIAGRSGHVTIRFDYTNRQYETVEIDGKAEKIYVPFAMLTGVLLDNESFTNVEVSNGKLVNDGARTAVIGVAFPGLQSNLNVDAEKFEIPSYFEITADVTDFEMGNTITVATKEPFDRMETDKLDSVEELGDSLGELSDAMNRLLDGSSQLYDGLCTLLEKSGTLTSGVNQLADGASRLQDGAGSVHSGAAALAAGTAELSAGLNTLNENSAALNDGARQVFETLLAAANTQLAAAGLSVPALTPENYGEVLNGVLAQLDPNTVLSGAQSIAQNKVAQEVNARRGEVEAAVTQAVRQQVTQQVADAVRGNVETQVLGTMGMTKEAYDAGVADGSITPEQQAQAAAAIEAQMTGDAVQAEIAGQTDAQMQSEAIAATIQAQTEQKIAELIAQNMNSDAVQGQINAALGTAQAGAAGIAALKAQLDSYNSFYTGLVQYTAGVGQTAAGAGQLNAGAAQLAGGTAQLQSGASELCGGVNTLKSNLPALTEGVTALCDGAMQLSGGLEEFNERGVQKLVDAAEGGLEGLTQRVRATAEVSRGWQSFSGACGEGNGQVNFLYRTDAIQKSSE